MSHISIEIEGLSSADLDDFTTILGAPDKVEVLKQRTTRLPGDLVSAAFILGVLNATPHLIKAFTDLLRAAAGRKYVKLKLVSPDGRTVVDGMVTPKQVEQLTKAFANLSGT